MYNALYIATLNHGYVLMYLKKTKLALATIACSISLGACSQAPIMMKKSSLKSHEYFAESKYGTKASPRVERSAHEVRTHAGNYVKLGAPYKVKNRWYYPQKNYAHYKQVGKASWYGSAFQGRLTANGEVYDMNGLSAAHPTMPLPSYARVTNLSNGSSIIVRVNDRGPYVSNRIIDLSKQAAKMLNYKDNGLANVKVEYIGLAPLKGDDSSYLIASYRNGYKNSRSILFAQNKAHKLNINNKNKIAYVPVLPSVGPILSFKDM